MVKPLVIIGHRLGHGHNVAKGVKRAGGKAIVIEGATADMKLGAKMKQHNGDIGISFCGSGGAGAISASNQYGYKAKSPLRTVVEGIGAIEQGFEVLGFNFMDTEELGFEITKTWLNKNK